MTGISEIILNDPIPITLQIVDGNTGQFPQAVIYGDGVYINTVNLTHITSGLYRYSGYVMPNNNEISIIYIIYSDSYGGTESTVYGRDIDIFSLITPSDYNDWSINERSQMRDALGVDGVKVKSTGGLLQKIKSRIDVIIAFIS